MLLLLLMSSVVPCQRHWGASSSLFVRKVSEDGWWRRLMIQGGGDTVLHLHRSCRSFLLSPQCRENNFTKNSLVSLKKSNFQQCWKGNRSQMVRNWKQKLISLLLKNFYHRILYDPILHLLSTFYFIYTGLSLFVHKVSEDGWWRR